MNGTYTLEEGRHIQPDDSYACLLYTSVQMLVHYLSDSLQSAAGYLMFADKRMELGGHLRKLPMGYFTSGNIGKISSVLSTDMVFIEEVAMSTLGNMMSYLLSSLVLLAFMFYLNWQLGLIAAIVTILAWLVSKGMNLSLIHILKEHWPGLYSSLILSEKLYPHLLEIDRAARERMDAMLPRICLLYTSRCV